MSLQAKVEKNVGLLIVLTLVAVIVGGLVQITPLFFQHSTTEPVEGLEKYSPLTLTGRDVYVREGCYLCHSQMIRPFRAETERYGHYSVAGEFVYDHPFQWGSKRTGPDLARVGGRYSDDWHRAHLRNPRDVVPESVMPTYAFLDKRAANAKTIQAKMRAMNVVVPFSCSKCDTYSEEEIAAAPKSLEGKTEMDALVAYLQTLGTAIKTVR